MSVEKRFAVKAQNGKYLIDGEVAPKLELISGKIYEFDLSDASLVDHPLKFKVGENIFNDSVSYDGTHGVDQVISLTVPSMTDGVGLMSYYCENHAGMGSDIEIKFNIIYGTDSNNSLTGLSGSDWIEGLEGNDTLDGGTGDDEIYGGAGDDMLNGGDGNDTLDGGAGDDTIVSGKGNDVLLGGSGNDYLDNGSGDDFIYGEDGDDTFINWSGTDYYDGGNGNDTIITDLSDEKIDGILQPQSFEIYLNLNDQIHGLPEWTTAPDTVINIENYTLIGDFDAELIGDDKNNIFTTDAGDDVIRGGAGDDTLSGGSGNDTLDGGDGGDYIDGGDGDDTIFGGAGNDIIDDGLGSDVVDAGDGIDTYTREFNDNTWIPHVDLMNEGLFSPTFPDIKGDTLISFENVDLKSTVDVIITGNDDNNILSSGSGNDKIYGGDGDDTLNAGSGDDQLYGGAGNDTLVQSGSGKQIFDGGAGVDTLYNNTDNYNNGLDADPPSWTAAINLSTGFLGVLEAPDHPTTDTVLNIENVHVEGRWNWEITGDGKANLLQSGSGDDVLTGGGGTDTLDGGAGDNALFGGDGNDTYVYRFEDGATTITDTGENTLHAISRTSDGTRLYGEMYFDDEGRLVIEGNELTAPNSKLVASGITDLYWTADDNSYSPISTKIYNSNVHDLQDDLSLTFIGTHGSNTITTNTTDKYTDVYTGDGDDIITIAGSGESWVASGGGDDEVHGSSGIDIVFGDGVNNWQNMDNAGDDYLNGYEGDDELHGGGGNDTLHGGEGDDTLDGGSGVNHLEGGEGDDVYSYAYNGIDTISDSGGNNDTVYLIARDAEDIPYFGDAYVENDKLIFVSSKNSSHRLTIEDAFSTGGKIEKITFHAESGRWNDYTLRIASIDDILDGSDISYWGTHSDDVIQMNDGYNEAYSSAGNDTILAGDGGSWISAGEGDDKIIGGIGVDYIVADNFYTSKTGADLISAGGGNDVIYLAASDAYSRWLSAKNVSSTFQTGTQELINLKNFLRTEDVVDGGADVDTIHLDSGNIALFLHDAFTAFHDEASLSNDSYGNKSVQRIDKIENIYGYDGNNLIDLTSPDYSLAGQNIKISGGDGDDTIWGSDADENILGDAGDDVLFGGAGENVLFGGDGADEFQFTKTSSNDTIADFNVSDGDTLNFFNTGGAQFDRDSIALSSAGDELSIAYGSDADDILTISLTNAGLKLDDLTADVLIIY